MLWNIHGEPIRAGLNFSTNGDTVVVPAITDGEIFIHKLIGGPDASVTVTLRCGARVVGVHNMTAGEALNENDANGMDGEPMFKCYPNEPFVINLSSGVAFTGSIMYSFKR